MPIRNFPFLLIPEDNLPRPWLPIRIINPRTGLFIDTFGLVDTGADDCAVPAFFAEELGHKFKIGVKDFLEQFELHINSPTFTFSIRYPKRGKS